MPLLVSRVDTIDKLIRFVAGFRSQPLIARRADSVLFVVGRAEFLQALPKLVDCFWRRAYNHAEEALLKETLGREYKAVLLRE